MDKWIDNQWTNGWMDEKGGRGHKPLATLHCYYTKHNCTCWCTLWASESTILGGHHNYFLAK